MYSFILCRPSCPPVFWGDQRQRIKKQLCALGVSACLMKSLLHLFHRGGENYFVKFVGVHGFKGSEVQGSILVPGLHLGCVFTRKASASSGQIQNFEQKLAIIW
jgi:hypothetical protein